MIIGFPPVWRADARLLILGSMPSEESLRQGFYYGHPRNAFWPILAESFGAEIPRSIEEKKALLIGNGIALWDSAYSCEREGSLDSAIRGAVPNDLAGLLARCPGIQKVLFNGKTAQKLARGIPEGMGTVCLPSTSPAYTLRYSEKLRLWRKELL